MKNLAGPESIAYGDLLASVEAQIPAPSQAAWRKRSWRSYAIRKNVLTHTEEEFLELRRTGHAQKEAETPPTDPQNDIPPQQSSTTASSEIQENQ